MNDLGNIPVRDRNQLPALLLQHYGKDSIEQFIDAIPAERKRTALRKTFFLEDSPLSPTSFTRKEPRQVEPAPRPVAKPRVRIPAQARKVVKKRSFMQRLKRKLIKMLR